LTKPIRAKISALGTYVPPRLLTNADLEKMVDTTNEWIMARVGIRERHIVEKGVATSDLAVEAARRRWRSAASSRATLTPSSWARLRRTCFFPRPPAWCSTSWAQRGRGDSTFGGLLGISLFGAGGRAIHRQRIAQAGAGDRGRRHVVDHRLHRPRHLRDLRRRRGGCDSGARGRRFGRTDRLHPRSGWLGRQCFSICPAAAA
jgi:hypothetical protein